MVIANIQIVERVNGYHLKKFLTSDNEDHESGSAESKGLEIEETMHQSDVEDTFNLPSLPPPMPSLSQLIRNVSICCQIQLGV